MKTNILILVLFSVIILTACSSRTNNWPRGMTPFFAECEGEGGTYTDKAYAVRKKQPCSGGWKFYDRGEPTLTN